MRPSCNDTGTGESHHSPHVSHLQASASAPPPPAVGFRSMLPNTRGRSTAFAADATHAHA